MGRAFTAKGRRGEPEREPMRQRQTDGRAPDNGQQITADRTGDLAMCKVLLRQRSELGNLHHGHVENHDRGLANELDPMLAQRHQAAQLCPVHWQIVFLTPARSTSSAV
jgi:hypothetical protein